MRSARLSEQPGLVWVCSHCPSMLLLFFTCLRLRCSGSCSKVPGCLRRRELSPNHMLRWSRKNRLSLPQNSFQVETTREKILFSTTPSLLPMQVRSTASDASQQTRTSTGNCVEKTHSSFSMHWAAYGTYLDHRNMGPNSNGVRASVSYCSEGDS
jgi:hypothetical protein